MIEPTPPIPDIARAIVARATAGRDTPAEVRQGIAAAFDRLNRTMSEIIGALGFRAVMMRGAQLARCDLASLEASPTEPPGTAAGSGPTEIHTLMAAAVNILEQVIGLLCTFIGHDLTFRLLTRVWPDLPAAPPPRHPNQE